jgi:hypothetical protein
VRPRQLAKDNCAASCFSCAAFSQPSAPSAPYCGGDSADKLLDDRIEVKVFIIIIERWRVAPIRTGGVSMAGCIKLVDDFLIGVGVAHRIAPYRASID